MKDIFLSSLKILNLVTVYCIIPCLYGCNESNNLNQMQGECFSTFPISDSVHFENYMELDSSDGKDGLYLNDTSIFLVNLSKLSKDFLFHEFNRTTHKKIGKFFRWGTETNEVYAPISNGLFNDSILWADDKALDKVLVASLQSKKSIDSIKIIEYPKVGFAYSTQLIKDSILLESGIYSSAKYLQKFDLISSKRTKEIGVFVPPNNKYGLYTWKGAFEGFMFVNKSNEIAAIASRYSDRVVFINIKNETVKVINGPYCFKPLFKPIKNLEMKNYMISRTSKTQFAFLKGASSNNFLYLLFSGKSEDEENYRFGNRIFVFDWNGLPIKELILDRLVSGFCVDDKTHELYAIDYLNNKIIKATIHD